jgi:hypothetical protein
MDKLYKELRVSSVGHKRREFYITASVKFIDLV